MLSIDFYYADKMSKRVSPTFEGVFSKDLKNEVDQNYSKFG
jgi:hypothetical protein